MHSISSRQAGKLHQGIAALICPFAGVAAQGTAGVLKMNLVRRSDCTTMSLDPLGRARGRRFCGLRASFLQLAWGEDSDLSQRY